LNGGDDCRRAVIGLGRPPFVGHPIDGRHDPGPLASSLAMHVHGLTRGIVHERQKLGHFLRRWCLVGRHRDPIEFHPLGLDKGRFLSFSIFGQINHRLDTERLEIGVVVTRRE
jgi:hypothetical protein